MVISNSGQGSRRSRLCLAAPINGCRISSRLWAHLVNHPTSCRQWRRSFPSHHFRREIRLWNFIHKPRCSGIQACSVRLLSVFGASWFGKGRKAGSITDSLTSDDSKLASAVNRPASCWAGGHSSSFKSSDPSRSGMSFTDKPSPQDSVWGMLCG